MVFPAAVTDDDVADQGRVGSSRFMGAGAFAIVRFVLRGQALTHRVSESTDGFSHMKHQHKGSRALWDRRPRQNRKPALWVGELVTPKGAHNCRVLNLSPGGAKVQLEAPVDLDDPVTLKLALVGTFAGSVRWMQDGCIGIVFKE